MKNALLLTVFSVLFGLATLSGQMGFTVNPDGTVSSGSLAVSGNLTAGALSVTQTIQAKAGFGYVPIGTILPWYNVSATATLPSGWYKCDGQSVAVPVGGEADLLDGVSNSMFATPNLNAKMQDGLAARGVFLRGGTVAGAVQSDGLQGHRMGISAGQGTHTHSEVRPPAGAPTPAGSQDLVPPDGGEGSQVVQTGASALPAMTADSIVTDGSNGTPRVTNETRPLNMSVIWIIRVQ